VSVWVLLDKMSTDVEPFRCQWFGSYFSCRIQRIKMGDCVSGDILVTLGVPQGSHLGHSVSFGLCMRSLGFLGTNGYFLC
jgi:hypothetical protein